jgi:hypothetical protein
MDDAAVDDFSDRIFHLLAAEEELQPLADHRLEIISAACQLIVGALADIEDSEIRDSYFRFVAEHVATIPERLEPRRCH